MILLNLGFNFFIPALLLSTISTQNISPKCWHRIIYIQSFSGSWSSSGDMLEGGLQLTGQMTGQMGQLNGQMTGQLTGQMGQLTGQIVKEPNNNINNDVTVSTNNDNTDICDETKNPLPLDQEEKVGKCFNLVSDTSVKH